MSELHLFHCCPSKRSKTILETAIADDLQRFSTPGHPAIIRGFFTLNETPNSSDPNPISRKDCSLAQK